MLKNYKHSRLKENNVLIHTVYDYLKTLSPYQLRILLYIYDNNNVQCSPNSIFRCGRLTHDLYYRVIVVKEIKILLSRNFLIETTNKSGKYKYYQLTNISIELISCLKKAVQT